MKKYRSEEREFRQRRKNKITDNYNKTNDEHKGKKVYPNEEKKVKSKHKQKISSNTNRRKENNEHQV